MSRINTNVSSLIAQRIVGQQRDSLNKSLERLSTGYRVNRGGDDPAGLIASERLRSEKAAISAAIGNAERADQVVNIAEGGLQEINTLLLEMQGLVGQTANEAGMSQDEREANQLQIDSILQTIDRISSATSFQGTKLLNGSFDFTVSGQSTSVVDFQVNGAKLNTGDSRTVEVVVTQSAQNAGLFLSLGGTSLDLSTTTPQFTFEVAGAKGSREFTFASGTTSDSIATAINSFTDVTGVSATVSGNGIRLDSDAKGSSEFVAIDIIAHGSQAGGVYQLSALDAGNADSGQGTVLSTIQSTGKIRDDGQDLGAMINGITATANGKVAKIGTDFIDLELELSDTASQSLGAITAFTITGGGAKFNLGPNVDIGNQVSIGIGNVAARNLGSVANGFLNELGSGQSSNLVDGDLGQAQKIINDSINQISKTRGRLGAFQKNIVGATIRSLGVALENTSAAESAIRDTDFASETAELTRSQILVQASQSALSIANSQPQSVLSLLG